MDHRMECLMESYGLNHMLSAAELHALSRAWMHCCEETDGLMRQLAVIYLQGMCDMLRAQERLPRATVCAVVDQARDTARTPCLAGAFSEP